MEETHAPVQKPVTEQQGDIQATAPSPASGRKPAPPARKRWYTLEGVLFGAALALYLLTRLFRIADFPIYFFTDEANQTMLAADLVRDGFTAYDGMFLPAFFYNRNQYNLGVSVYLQVLPYMLFGKTVWLTRAVASATTLLAALAAGVTLQKVFKIRHAWTAVLLLSITPAWFLHSRTAFETSLAVTFFAVFLYGYLRYVSGAPGYLYLAVAAGALVFYSYSPARAVIGATALLLLISDFRYHLQQRKTVLRAFALMLLFCIPLLRFWLRHPTAMQEHLSLLNSYWVENIPLTDKLGVFLKEYVRGLNPLYWYLPNNTDLIRHLMKGYGHVLWWTFPFLLTGLGLAISRVKRPENRTLLAAVFAAPAGAALVVVGITRILLMVVPLALLSGIGLNWIIDQAVTLLPRLRTRLPVAVFCMLALVNIIMVWDAVRNSPLWYQDYGLTGMQWSARRLFSEVDQYMQEHPEKHLIVSPSWANGTDVVARFFYPLEVPFELGSIEGYITELTPLDEDTVFVMIPSEYDQMLESGKFTDVRVEKTILYPNGQAGFLFIRLRYVDNIEEIVAEEIQARRRLQEEQISVGSEVWQVRYSWLDMGPIDKAFDGNYESLVRTQEANPLVIEARFPSDRIVQTIKVKIGGPPAVVNITLITPQGTVIPITRTAEKTNTPRVVEFDLNGPVSVVMLRVEVNSVLEKEPAHVHLWEIGIE